MWLAQAPLAPGVRELLSQTDRCLHTHDIHGVYHPERSEVRELATALTRKTSYSSDP